MLRAHLLTLFLGLIAAISAGCAPTPTDHPQNTPQPRLAVLSPAMTIILRDLEALDHVVGRHAYDLILTSTDIPVLGNETGLDYEALIAADPDILLLEGNRRGIPHRLQALADERNWRIETIPLLTLPDILAAINRLDTLLHPPSGSDYGASLTLQLQAAWDHSPQIQSRLGRTIALASTDPPGVLGPGSFHYQLLAKLGAKPLPNSGMPYITMSPEDIKHLAPDSLVIFAPGSDQTIDDLLGPLTRIGLTAIQENRVFVIRDPFCHTPSTALINIAQELRVAAGVAP